MLSRCFLALALAALAAAIPQTVSPGVPAAGARICVDVYNCETRPAPAPRGSFLARSANDGL
jgi:hypothetical protein